MPMTRTRLHLQGPRPLLGGSWLVISGVIIRITIVLTHFRALIDLLITTHEPPSTPTTRNEGVWVSGFRVSGFRQIQVLRFGRPQSALL